VFAYSAIVAYFLGRLVWRSWSLSALRKGATEVLLTGEAESYWTSCSDRFRVHHAALAASSEIFGPVTLGIQRKLVLLPVSMMASLQGEDLQTVVAHEFAHMQRQDFQKNLLYELCSLTVCYHPLFWLTRERLVESREMACDEMVANITGRKEYAQSLLRLASLLVNGRSARVTNAIGIFDANEFERRLMKLTERQERMSGMQRVAMIAVCVALGVGTCGSALALRMNVNAAAVIEEEKAAPGNDEASQVSATVMAGNLLTRVLPAYPDAAKKAKIQGAVLLHAIINKEGVVEDLQVISGPEELRQSTLDAVSQWKYKPYLLNGEPVEVMTTVTVTYSLPH
jgi:bla regulator protein blaR1